jgi:predicted O-methyltransferase YrrM
MDLARRIWQTGFFPPYMYIFGSRIAASNLKNLADDCGEDIGNLVNLAFSFEYRQKIRKSWVVNIQPGQVKSEITELCKIIRELNPKKIVEIGSKSGGTLFLFARVANAERIISIDLPSGTFGGGYSYWKIPFLKSLGKRSVIQLIRADSHKAETLRKLKSLLKGSKVDLLFIDGDHTYQGVKQDFQLYSSLVRKGGIVAFHDIVTHDPTVGCEVDRFWNEIKPSHTHIEIIEDQNQKWAGIGVLFF